MTKIVTVEQFADLPEGATVLVPVKYGTCRMVWRDGLLHGDLQIDGIPQAPQRVLALYGPLTVQDRK